MLAHEVLGTPMSTPCRPGTNGLALRRRPKANLRRLEMDIELLRKEISVLPWFHRIDLGNGIITPGRDIDGQAKIGFNKIPTDFSGKTVLDIGAWDGLFS